MSQSIFSKLGDELVPPQVGQISVFLANSTASTIDLGACGPGAADMRNADAYPVSGGYEAPGTTTPSGQNGTVTGCLSRFTEVFADSADIGVIFASNAAVFANATVAANLAASGANGAGCAMRIPGGTYRTFTLHATSRFMSVVTASGNCNVRICATSRTG